MTFENQRAAAEQLLVDRGADREPHPGGTLLEHLRRVEQLLGTWQASDSVRLAGLTHAAYGTDGFPSSLLELSERMLLSDAIGAEAEELVYQYGCCDRDATYPQLSEPGQVVLHDRFAGASDVLSEPAVRALCEITAANELDVVRHNADVRAQHGRALRDLMLGAGPRVSEVARRAWSAEFSMPHIESIDHVVLTVRDLQRTIRYYTDTLGMTAVTFNGDRHALVFGAQKINLHAADSPVAPHAATPTPGSADLCLISATPLDDVAAHLDRLGVATELGPVSRTGARGKITSIYLRDPDENLIEISNYEAR